MLGLNSGRTSLDSNPGCQVRSTEDDLWSSLA